MSDTQQPISPPRVCWFELACSRKMPAGWRWFRSQVIEGGFLMTGGIPTVYVRGPRKGSPKWDEKAATICFVSRDEVDAERNRWQTETGKCNKCQGDGKSFYSWSKQEGSKYRPCESCNGSGVPA